MLLGKNHRHTGMDLRDEVIRLACDNRASAKALPRFGIIPSFPKSGKSEQTSETSTSVFHGSNDVLRRRFGSTHPRQDLNVRFFLFGVVRPNNSFSVDRRGEEVRRGNVSVQVSSGS